ncbi:MAG: hypothetical protein ACLPID_00550 [Beijerinckiaceae bacterium]
MSLQTSLDADFGTVSRLIGEIAQAAPDRTALIDCDRRLSFGELDILVHPIAPSHCDGWMLPACAAASSRGI